MSEGKKSDMDFRKTFLTTKKNSPKNVFSIVGKGKKFTKLEKWTVKHYSKAMREKA